MEDYNNPMQPNGDESQQQSVNKMFCRKCGNELRIDAKFCTKCGAKTLNVEPIIPVTATPQPEAPQPETEMQPEAPQPETEMQPEAPQPEAEMQPETPQPETEMQPEAPQPEAEMQPEVPQTEAYVQPEVPQYGATEEFIPAADTTGSEKKKSGSKALLIILIVVGVLLLGAIGAGYYFINMYKTQSEEYSQEIAALNDEVDDAKARLEASENKVDELNEQVDGFEAEKAAIEQAKASLESENAGLKKQVADLKNENIGYSAKARDYDDIVSFGRTGGIGAQDGNFYSSENLIVMKKSASSKNITITSSFSGYVTLNMSTSGNSANIKFNQSSWSGSTTTLNIKPVYTGVTTATITNSRNAKQMKIVVVVTD